MYVAAHHREDAEGEETAREKVGTEVEHSVSNRRLLDGITLKRSEGKVGRPVRDHLSGHRKVQRPQGPAQAKAEEGAANR